MGWVVSRSPSVGPGEIGRPTRRSGRVQEAHPKVRKDHSGSERGREAYQRSRRGRVVHTEVWEGSGGPPGGPEEV